MVVCHKKNNNPIPNLRIASRFRLEIREEDQANLGGRKSHLSDFHKKEMCLMLIIFSLKKGKNRQRW